MPRNRMPGWLGVVALFLVAITSSRSYAGFVGDTVRLTREIPTPSFVFGPFTFVVQAGTADTVAMSTGNNSYVNVEDTSLLLTFGPAAGSG